MQHTNVHPNSTFSFSATECWCACGVCGCAAALKVVGSLAGWLWLGSLMRCARWGALGWLADRKCWREKRKSGQSRRGGERVHRPASSQGSIRACPSRSHLQHPVLRTDGNCLEDWHHNCSQSHRTSPKTAQRGDVPPLHKAGTGPSFPSGSAS